MKLPNAQNRAKNVVKKVYLPRNFLSTKQKRNHVLTSLAHNLSFRFNRIVYK